MRLKCIDARGTEGLTKGKIYEMIDGNFKFVNVRNDKGQTGHYKINRFKIAKGRN